MRSRFTCGIRRGSCSALRAQGDMRCTSSAIPSVRCDAMLCPSPERSVAPSHTNAQALPEVCSCDALHNAAYRRPLWTQTEAASKRLSALKSSLESIALVLEHLRKLNHRYWLHTANRLRTMDVFASSSPDFQYIPLRNRVRGKAKLRRMRMCLLSQLRLR